MTATMTWRETKAKAALQYAVSNERYRTKYTIPLAGGDRLEIGFRLKPSDQGDELRDGSKPQVEFFLSAVRDDDEPGLSVMLGKEDIATLQKLLLSILEHSRLRRFEWLAEGGKG